MIEQVTNTQVLEPNKDSVTEVEIIPSMDDFKDELNESFKTIAEGDIVKGTIIGISDSEVTVDLGYYTDGIIPLEELSNDPRFSIKSDLLIGDEVSAVILKKENREGHMVLSMKQAADLLAWDKLKESMENRQIHSVKIAQTVNGGVITYLEGIRAFIPASLLSLTYVDDLETWVGKTIDTIIVTVEEEKSKLVLSGKEVEKDRAIQDKHNKVKQLQRGIVTTGIVENLTTYGAFVSIGNGLSGLVHISEICKKRIKSPKEVVQEGQEVTVKIIDIKDGKISLSMKAVEDTEEVMEDVDTAPMEYLSEESATTGLAGLLTGIKIHN